MTVNGSRHHDVSQSESWLAPPQNRVEGREESLPWFYTTTASPRGRCIDQLYLSVIGNVIRPNGSFFFLIS